MLIINILKNKGRLFCCLSICFLVFSCIQNNDNNRPGKTNTDSLLRGDFKFKTIEVKSLSKVEQINKIDSLEQQIIDSGLVDIPVSYTHLTLPTIYSV